MLRLYTKYRPDRRRGKRRGGAGAIAFVSVALLGGMIWLGRQQSWWLRPGETPVALSKVSSPVSSNSVPTAVVVAEPVAEPPRASNQAVKIAASQPAASSPPLKSNAVLEAQIALDRLGISPGSIDGVPGGQTRCALRAFQMREQLPATGELDAETRAKLSLTTGLTTCRVELSDLSRLLPLSPTWLGKSEQERLGYETVLELVSERSHAHPKLIRKLNSSVDWSALPPGAEVVVPRVEREAPRGKAAVVEIVLSARTLQAFDSEHRLLAHFPCSIAQHVEKRPVGALHVAVLAPNPNYTFQPEVFPESAEAREIGHKLVLKPGPNNPVGTVWIGLDKPGYGIHGTPSPEDVGRTESHGCFRLANWNAEYLLQLVGIGTPVQIIP